MTYFCSQKQWAGLSRACFGKEKSPGNIEHPTPKQKAARGGRERKKKITAAPFGER